MSMPTPLNHHNLPTEKGRVLIISLLIALLPPSAGKHCNAYLVLMKERRNLLRLEAKDEPSGHVDGGPVLACESTEGADGDVR
jgi:hypothetical protein